MKFEMTASETARYWRERRQRMAEDKSAAAEREAIADVRNRAAIAATAASRKLIAEKHDAEADKALADQLIAGI